MAYDTGHFTNLGQLKKLAQRTKTELDALDTRVSAIEAIDPEQNVIVGVQVNGSDLTVDSNRKVNVQVPVTTVKVNGSALTPDSSHAVNVTVPTKTSDLTNDSTFLPEETIDAKISAAVAGSLIPGGSVTFANLPQLIKANVNHIYNVSDVFTTTADFVEGAGKKYPAGTNVAIINTGTSSSPVYKYDCYTGTFDFSGFMEKQTGAANGNFAKFDANGQAVDAGCKPADFFTVEDAADKADKKVPATAGNVATLDANGNLADGGKTVSQLENVIVGVQVNGSDLTPDGNKKVNVVISGKADKVSSATNDDLASLDANGNLRDSGIAKANVMQKVTGAVSGNVATFNSSGFVQDSSTALSSLLVGTAATDAEVTEMIDEVFSRIELH